VHALSLEERVVQVADVLRDEGILNDVVDEGERFRLRNIGCPYRATAEGTHVACAADRRAIELLLGESVEQVATIVEGARTCDYLVAKIAKIEASETQQGEGEREHARLPQPALRD
jgi:predicted ArsR family transcriptional regulator